MRIPAAVVCALLAFPCVAQPVTETVEVHVLEVEAVVLDRAGKTVEGLTRGDFDVSIDGKPAEITNFYRVRRGAIESGPALPSGERIVPVTKTESRLIVVLDDLHLRQAPRNRALAALRKYVETSLDDSTSVMILRWNGSLGVRMNSSKERSKILAEIAQLEREPATMIRTDIERRRIMQTVHEALEAPKFPKDSTRVAAMAMHYAVMFATDEGRVVERTAAALGELVSMAAGLPGRKVVLYVSESLQVHPGAEMMAYARESLRDRIPGFDVEVHPGGNVLDDLRFDQTRAFQDLVQRAQSAGVIFSALDPGGLRAESTSFETSSLGYAPVGTTSARANDTAGMRIVSAETGGRFIGNENDLDHAIAVLTDDVSSYYSIGVRAPDKKAVGVEVRVRGRDDVRVLATRRRVLMSPDEAIASALRARLYSREQTNPLGARVYLGTAWPEGGKCMAPVQVVVPSESLTMFAQDLRLQGTIAIHAIALDDRQQESPVRKSEKNVVVKPGEAVEEALVFGYQPRRYLVSIAIVDTLSGTTSYLQTEVDATICGR